MFFNEHNPPHIHIKYQEFEATIQINDGIVQEKYPELQ